MKEIKSSSGLSGSRGVVDDFESLVFEQPSTMNDNEMTFDPMPISPVPAAEPKIQELGLVLLDIPDKVCKAEIKTQRQPTTSPEALQLLDLVSDAITGDVNNTGLDSSSLGI